MRQTCDDLAAQGYVAVCPDLFWRIAPGLDLSDRTEAELAQAQALYNAFDLDAGVSDIAATVQATRAMPEVTGKIGVVGYCLGGLLAFLTAARARPDATVAFYPGNADKHVREADRIANPLIVHLAQKDEYIPADAQRQIASELNRRPQVQVYSYPGCGHAFARHRGTAYNAEAAAWPTAGPRISWPFICSRTETPDAPVAATAFSSENRRTAFRGPSLDGVMLRLYDSPPNSPRSPGC